MQKKHVKILLFIAVLTMFSAVLFTGCSRDTGPDGELPANVAPRCYLSNIPTPGEEYSRNPTLYWYATDEDGFVRKFRYIVKKAGEINEDPLAYAESVMESGNYDGWTVIYTDSLAPGKSATSDTIPFYAVADPSIYIDQYFFVQAVDNEDLFSKFTDTVNGEIKAIAYRMFSRNDHAPETHMGFEPDSGQVFFSLVDTTDTYKGVQISWSGSDSLDYKSAQPPFEYHWRVFGPFDSEAEATNQDPSKFIFESYDSATADVWVSEEATTLFNLYRNEPPSDTTRANYFFFDVRARDDAFVPDSTPATAVFYAIEPGFEKGLMLVDNNMYVGVNFVYHCWDSRAEYDDQSVVKITDFYKSVFQQAGYVPDTFYQYIVPGKERKKPLPGLDTLLQYKYIVLLNETNEPVDNITTAMWPKLSDYMDLGGRVMFIGWNTYVDKALKGRLNQFGPTEFPYKYFGITAEYYTSWDRPDTSHVKKFGINVGVTPEEMIQAEGIVPDLPQILTVDSSHMADYYINDMLSPYPYDTIWQNGQIVRILSHQYGNKYDLRNNAEPWVSYYVKSTAAEALYIAKSIYSSKDEYGFDRRDFLTTFRDMESIDGRVCGVRLQTDVFRTASFSFSLYCMPEAEAVELIRSIMDWLTADSN